MKNNLYLFLGLIFLLVLTYFFQEKRVERDYHEALTEGRLLQKEITSLKLPDLEAVKKKGQWWSEDQLLSHNTFKLLEKKLSEVKKVKKVEGDWDKFFPHPFEFEVNGQQWTIGDMSLDKESFYIGVDKNIYLAVIEGESRQLTSNEDEIAALKLNELISALSKSKEELKEKQLFRYYPELPLKRILINTQGNLSFELNLEDNTTLPPPIKGISVHKDLMGKFFSLLSQITLKQEVPFKKDLAQQKIAEMSFLEDGKKIVWELWIKNKSSADAIIIDPENKRAFSLVGGTLKPFFIHLQDYWDKKVIPPEDFKNFTRLESTFIEGNKKETVVIINREPLAFEARKYKVAPEKMNELMSFLFNLGSKDQGSRVSLLSTSERKQLLSEDHLRVNLMGQDLLIWRKADELIVVNLTQGFKVHFLLLAENTPSSFEDVLK